MRADVRPHRRGAASLAVGAALLLLTAACGPGDGSELDENGRAYAHPGAAGVASRYGAAEFPASYSGIAEGFFEAFCTQCHVGEGAPKGLSLTPDDAYEHLVGVPSVQRPSYLLVEPGEPDLSYLIIKLEGSDGMAGRLMPRGLSARPQQEIDAIRLWIAEGAPFN